MTPHPGPGPWIVVCDNARSGDVIEHPVTPIATQHDTPEKAFADAGRWYRAGPNGPVRTAYVTHRGRRVSRNDVWPQHGPSMPIKLKVSLSAVFPRPYEATATFPDGTKWLASLYGSWHITASSALRDAREWAESRRLTIISEETDS